MMIGNNKVIEGLKKINEGWKVIFIFNFLDRLCYYNLNKENDIEVVKRAVSRQDRGYKEISDLAFIPTNKLKDIVVY